MRTTNDESAEGATIVCWHRAQFDNAYSGTLHQNETGPYWTIANCIFLQEIALIHLSRSEFSAAESVILESLQMLADLVIFVESCPNLISDTCIYLWMHENLLCLISNAITVIYNGQLKKSAILLHWYTGVLAVGKRAKIVRRLEKYMSRRLPSRMRQDTAGWLAELEQNNWCTDEDAMLADLKTLYGLVEPIWESPPNKEHSKEQVAVAADPWVVPPLQQHKLPAAIVEPVNYFNATNIAAVVLFAVGAYWLLPYALPSIGMTLLAAAPSSAVTSTTAIVTAATASTAAGSVGGGGAAAHLSAAMLVAATHTVTGSVGAGHPFVTTAALGSVVVVAATTGTTAATNGTTGPGMVAGSADGLSTGDNAQ